MGKPKLVNSHSLPARILCLFMAGSTVCGTAGVRRVRHEPGTENPPTESKAEDSTQSWGAKREGSNARDMEVAPGFLLALSSTQDNRLNGTFRVDFDGNMQLPYNVRVGASGQSVSRLENAIADSYRPYFKSQPDLKLSVKEQRYWIDVRGLVTTPGRYLVEADAPIDRVIALAGGFSRDMAPQFVSIEKGPKKLLLDLNRYYTDGEGQVKILGWLGGETLFFRKEEPLSSRSAYVLGEVRRPGAYDLPPGRNFTDLLKLSNGFTEVADMDNIEIIRQDGGKSRIYEVPWSRFQQAPAPKDGDLLVVHAAQVSKTERQIALGTVVATLLASLASLAVVASRR